jgi:competence protein ComEA
MNRIGRWFAGAAAVCALGIAPGLARAQGATLPALQQRHGGNAALSGTCNLNTADATQLALLPGVGPTRARAIIAYRQKQPFRSVEDVVKVKGIGRKTFAHLRPYVSVSGATTIARAGGAHRAAPGAP